MLSIIIPTYNEEEGIAKTICGIPKEIRNQSELIVVDVSTDMTPVIAEELGAKVLRPKRKGKGFQMRHAAERSKGDILVFMDGDGTDPGTYIPKLIKKLESANLVLASRVGAIDDDQAAKKIFQAYSMIAYPIAHTLHLDVSDPLAGMRAIRRKDWDALQLKANDFEIEIEMNISAVKKGFKISDIKIPSVRRAGGVTSSKFLRSPKMWVKVAKMLVDYAKDERLQAQTK